MHQRIARILAEDPRLHVQAWAKAMDGDVGLRLEAHWDILKRWGRKINLSGIWQPELAARLHYADALAGLWALEDLPAGACVIDLGSGAGFPGLVLAAARPDLKITLIEPRRRRASFLRAARAAMDLTHVGVMESRLEPGPAGEALLKKAAPDGHLAAMVSRATFGRRFTMQDVVKTVAPWCHSQRDQGQSPEQSEQSPKQSDRSRCVFWLQMPELAAQKNQEHVAADDWCLNADAMGIGAMRMHPSLPGWRQIARPGIRSHADSTSVWMQEPSLSASDAACAWDVFGEGSVLAWQRFGPDLERE